MLRLGVHVFQCTHLQSDMYIGVLTLNLALLYEVKRHKFCSWKRLILQGICGFFFLLILAQNDRNLSEITQSDERVIKPQAYAEKF